ncbi:hypothetical protein Ancab_039210 [Ancistrocladus abbreviatus]
MMVDLCCHAESVVHVLRACGTIAIVWHRIIPRTLCSSFFKCDREQWLQRNQSDIALRARSLPWRCVFAMGVCMLWMWRNKVIFANEEVSSLEKDEMFFRQAIQYQQALHICAKVQSETLVRWRATPIGGWLCWVRGNSSRRKHVFGRRNYMTRAQFMGTKHDIEIECSGGVLKVKIDGAICLVGWRGCLAGNGGAGEEVDEEELIRGVNASSGGNAIANGIVFYYSAVAEDGSDCGRSSSSSSSTNARSSGNIAGGFSLELYAWRRVD